MKVGIIGAGNIGEVIVLSTRSLITKTNSDIATEATGGSQSRMESYP
jgi:pyrroline-5-carboxylate reductase